MFVYIFGNLFVCVCVCVLTETEARKIDESKATTPTSAERVTSSGLQARGGGDSGVSASTLKRAAEESTKEIKKKRRCRR